MMHQYITSPEPVLSQKTIKQTTMSDANLLENIFSSTELKYFRDLYFIARCKEFALGNLRTEIVGQQSHYPRIPGVENITILSYVSGELGLSKNAGRITRAISDLENQLDNEREKVSRYPTIKLEIEQSGGALFERRGSEGSSRDQRDYEKPTRLADLLNNALDREDIYGDIQLDHDERAKQALSRQTGIADPDHWPLQLRFVYSPTLWSQTVNEWLQNILDRFPAASVIAWANDQSFILEQLRSAAPFRADLALTYGAIKINGYEFERIASALLSPFTDKNAPDRRQDATDDIFVWVPHAIQTDAKKNDLYPNQPSVLNPRAIFNTTETAAEFLQTYPRAVGYLPEQFPSKHNPKFGGLERTRQITLNGASQTLTDIDTSIYLHYREDIRDLVEGNSFEKHPLYDDLTSLGHEELKAKLSNVPIGQEETDLEPSPLKQAELLFLAAATNDLLKRILENQL